MAPQVPIPGTSVHQEVPSSRILRACAYLPQEAAFHESSEPRTRGTGCQANHVRDVARHAAPLPDQAESVKDTADHTIAQFRNAAAKIFHREAEGQEPGVLDLLSSKIATRIGAPRCA